MKYFAKAAPIVCIAIFASCANMTDRANSTAPKFDLGAMKSIIDLNNVKYGQSFLKGDSATFTDLHHSQSINMPPNEIPKSKTEMGAMIKSVPQMGIKSYKVQAIEVFGGPIEVVERGQYEVGDSIHVLDKGKYIVVWKQEDGTWKIYRSIWNSDMPAQSK